MTLTPSEQKAEGRRFRAAIMRAAVGSERYNCDLCGDVVTPDNLSGWDDDGHVYCSGHGRPLAAPCSDNAVFRTIEAHGADAAPARPEQRDLLELIRWAHDTLYEINPSNYDHDEVCKLNDASVEVILGLAPVLGEAHGKSSEWWSKRDAPARPTPFPADYSELVFGSDGWSQTIIVDGKRPEWLRDDDRIRLFVEGTGFDGNEFDGECAIRVRRRKPKRETVGGALYIDGPFPKMRATIDLIDGKPDLSTLKIAEDAL